MAKKATSTETNKQKKLRAPPFETASLREQISKFYETPYTDASGTQKAVGSYTWGVYLFYDYDGEPIYVGQSYEKIGGRIGRHMTNQRTDAVAMSVLDPFEVCEIAIYPLPEFEGINKDHPRFKEARKHLNALEYAVHQEAIGKSAFKAILNEQIPKTPLDAVPIPTPIRGRIVSDDVLRLRAHPDVRIARRAQTIAKLAQVISERELRGDGLRRVIVVQSDRLAALANKRFVDLYGKTIAQDAKEGGLDGEDGDEDDAEVNDEVNGET
ncbi:MAG: nuclease family protein [Hyphomicrobiales bacterium]|nr:nuclease family protein [Hyphomicrobiales bacterium]